MSSLTFRYFVNAVVAGPNGLKRTYFAIDSTLRTMDSGDVTKRFEAEYARFHGFAFVSAKVYAINDELIDSDHVEKVCHGMPLVPVA